MLNIVSIVRKTGFLSGSGLKCLAGLGSVNVSAGCGHGVMEFLFGFVRVFACFIALVCSDGAKHFVLEYTWAK